MTKNWKKMTAEKKCGSKTTTYLSIDPIESGSATLALSM
jgi:hypothetical protein